MACDDCTTVLGFPSNGVYFDNGVCALLPAIERRNDLGQEPSSYSETTLIFPCDDFTQARRYPLLGNSIFIAASGVALDGTVPSAAGTRRPVLFSSVAVQYDDEQYDLSSAYYVSDDAKLEPLFDPTTNGGLRGAHNRSA